MTPERWQRVCTVFAAALRCDPEGRVALLHEACGGDPELRAEVDRLLSDDAGASRDGFLDLPDTMSGLVDSRGLPTVRIRRAELQIVCPHCKNPIELLGRDDPEDIVCPCCGSTVHVELRVDHAVECAARPARRWPV